MGVFVFVHDATSPGDADWHDAMVDLEAYAQKQKPVAVIFTDGGAPTLRQRGELNRLVGSSPPTAVVSDALVTRFIVSSLALVNSSIASFTTKEISAAWAHVGLQGAEMERAMGELQTRGRTLAHTFKTLGRAIGSPI